LGGKYFAYSEKKEFSLLTTILGGFCLKISWVLYFFFLFLKKVIFDSFVYPAAGFFSLEKKGGQFTEELNKWEVA